MASERCRARVKRLRFDWFRQRMPVMQEHPERIVFIDETSVKTNLTRLRGRAPKGQRLVMDAPFGSWGTQTFIAGLTSDAMIAPWVIKGAMDGDAFAAYIRNVLAPELAPRTVVVLDNLATRLREGMEWMITDYYSKAGLCRPFEARGLLVTGPSRIGKSTETPIKKIGK